MPLRHHIEHHVVDVTDDAPALLCDDDFDAAREPLNERQHDGIQNGVDRDRLRVEQANLVPGERWIKQTTNANDARVI